MFTVCCFFFHSSFSSFVTAPYLYCYFFFFPARYLVYLFPHLIARLLFVYDELSKLILSVLFFILILSHFQPAFVGRVCVCVRKSPEKYLELRKSVRQSDDNNNNKKVHNKNIYRHFMTLKKKATFTRVSSI